MTEKCFIYACMYALVYISISMYLCTHVYIRTLNIVLSSTSQKYHFKNNCFCGLS